MFPGNKSLCVCLHDALTHSHIDDIKLTDIKLYVVQRSKNNHRERKLSWPLEKE